MAIRQCNKINIRYQQNWASGSSFFFRYRANVYAYAYYEANEYDVSFMVPETNKVGVVQDYANYVNYDVETYEFNHSVSAYDFSLVGYTFHGWYITTALLTEENTYSVTNNYLKGTYFHWDNIEKAIVPHPRFGM